MPVEIKELVIRITDTAHQNPKGNASTKMPSQEALVAACVKQVLKIIEKKQKR